MSEQFLGGTTDNLATEYQERVRYRNYLLRSNYEFLDTLYGKSLYGFINRDYEVIAPTPSIVSFGDYASDVEGLQFVVNQFNKFREYYLQKETEGSFVVPTLISGLIPKRSYKDYELSYTGYIQAYQSRLIQNAINYGDVLSFKEFIEVSQDMIFDIQMRVETPTKSGFMLSPNSDVYNTGLYIDMRQSTGIVTDQERYDFIESDGFECFYRAANDFGFYVDGNNPWRIAVNLSHEYTRSLLLNGRPMILFDNFYSDEYTIKVGHDDYWAIQRLYKEAYVAYNELSGRQVLRNFDSQIKKELWLETLLLSKFAELSLMRSPRRTQFFVQTLQKVLDLNQQHRLLSISGPIGYINAFCAEQLKNKILGQP